MTRVLFDDSRAFVRGFLLRQLYRGTENADPLGQTYGPSRHRSHVGAWGGRSYERGTPVGNGETPSIWSGCALLRVSGDTHPCRMTGVTLHSGW